MTTAAQYSQMLLAPWRQRDLSAPWGRRLIAALLAIVSVPSLVFMPPEFAWVLPGVIMLMIMLGTWMAMGQNLQEQNHPHAARYVPGHVRALRQATLLGWALVSVLASVLIWVTMPPFASWQGLLLTSGLVAVFLLWAWRLWGLVLLLTLLSPLLGAFSSELAPVWHLVSGIWQDHTPSLLLLSLLAQAWLVTRAIDGGGAAHQARYAQREMLRRAMQMQMPFDERQRAARYWGPLEGLGRIFTAPTSAWLRHLLARADNASPRSVMARAEITLYGPQHWLAQLMTFFTIGAVWLIALAIVLLTFDVGLGGILQHGGLAAGCGIAGVGLSGGLALPGALWRTRREQALLRLLPGMPQGRALNRILALCQLRDFGIASLLPALALVALGTQTDSSYLLCLPLATLPIAVFCLTRHPASMRAPTAMTIMLPMFAVLGLALLPSVLVQYLGLPLWPLALAMLALSAGLLAWRWRALTAAPTALPAGRLG
jgi:hypothetical protein